MKKIIITGGCGFIGSNLTDYLIKKGYKVILIDNFSKNKINKPNKKSLLYKINIKNINKLKKIGDIFAVIHLAASAEILISKKNEKKYFQDNIEGLQEVLNFCSLNKITRFIFASSASVYGNIYKKSVKENCLLNPSHYYAYTKFIGEQMIKAYTKTNNFNFTILRLFNIYGPRSNAVISTFLAQKIQKKPITIFGNGRQIRDFLYVDDFCDAILKVLNNKSSKNQIYNLGFGKPVSINEIKKKIKYENFLKLTKRSNDIEISIANISKIKKDLNWYPKTFLDQGINLTLNKDFNRLSKIEILKVAKLKSIIKQSNK